MGGQILLTPPASLQVSHALVLQPKIGGAVVTSSVDIMDANFSKALDLLQQLQNTIETQQKDIDRLTKRMTMMKELNQKLRKERDDLRVTNAEHLQRIAQLSRRSSLFSSPSSLRPEK